MNTLTIRKVPDHVYRKLADWARQNRRSLQEQVRYLLEQEVKLNDTSVLEEAGEYRSRLSSRSMGDVVSDVREDRCR